MYLIGDAHGKRDFFKIYNLIDDSIIQIGDFGLWHTADFHCSSDKLQVFPGNHDDYDNLFKSPLCLGDFGTRTFNDFSFFFVRGGVSIDRSYRVSRLISKSSPKTWWSSEELNYVQMRECEQQYKKAKPDILLAHTAPIRFKKVLVGENKSNDIVRNWGFDLNYEENTSVFLEYLLSIHMPKLFACGHFHKSAYAPIDGCNFYCLNELEARKIEGFTLK